MHFMWMDICISRVPVPALLPPFPLSLPTGAFGRVYKGILTLPGVYTENKLTLRTLVAVKTVKSESSPMCMCVEDTPELYVNSFCNTLA